MVQLVVGRSGSGKTEYVHNDIDKQADGREIILLVPEQSSFQSEKRILDDLGAERARNISVLSFKRLYNAVTEKYGGANACRIDDGTKAVLMSVAAEEISDKLTLYGSRCRRADLAELMVSTVDEYKLCAITPERLFEAAERVESVRLRQKLKESAAIYAAYNALLGQTYEDPDDDLVRLYDMLCKYPFFKSKTVYIDSFNGFSGQELKVLECILRQAEDIIITLGCDESRVSELDGTVFREPDITRLKLIETVKRLGIEIAPEIRLKSGQRYKSPSIAALEESVFRFDGDMYLYDDDSVTLYEADDEYDEICQTARKISQLVMDEGYEYRDITVICRHPEMYKSIIASEYAKFNIPYFLSDPRPLENEPLIRLVLSSFDIIHSSFNTENILTFLKTGLTPLSDNDVFLLENYAYLWDIRGKRWRSPFTMNPDGNSDTINEAELEYIEKLRKSVITPLEKFASAVKKSDNGGDISKAVYNLLCQLSSGQKMKALIFSFEENNDMRAAETEARVWDILMHLLDNMYNILKNTSLDSKRYLELLKLMIRKNPISDIPQTLDQVLVGVAGNIRTQGQRAVFVIGASEGEFPAPCEASGLFSDSERTSLIDLNIPVYDTVYDLPLKEKYNAYAALALPSERLYVSRPLSTSKGDRCEPSIIFKEIVSVLPVRIKRRKDLSISERFFTEAQTFEECASMWNDNTPMSAALKEYFRDSEEYSDRYSAVSRSANEEPVRITDPSRVKKLFGEKLRLSASQTETYYLCPFRYFCRYGLKAYPRKKAAMDPAMYGSAVHYTLEQILRNEDHQQLRDGDEKLLHQLIEKYIRKYIDEIGGDSERTKRFMAQFASIEKNLLILLKRLIDELRASSFVPTDLELDISDDGDIPAYEISLPGGDRAVVTGKIDRVDTFVHEGKKYIRIMDYKTGNKKFRLSDVLYGLNIQMLLYLSIIEKQGGEYYSEGDKYSLAPAGILYMPSTPTSKTGDYNNTDEHKAALKEQQSNFRMNGLLIDDKEILDAMEKDVKGIFIPAKLNSVGDFDKRGGNSLISLEAYGKLFSYIDKKLIEMAQSIFDGKLERNPVKGAEDACRYCDYKNICGYEKGKCSSNVEKISMDNALKIICGEEGNKDE